MEILLVGSTGTLGSRIAQEANDRGHSITGVSRSSERAMDIEKKASIEKFFDKEKRYDAVICAAGNAAFGSFKAQKEEDFDLGIHSKMSGQVALVRHALKRLNNEGRIVLTGGMLAYSPWPETSSVALVNAGLEGFVRAVNLDLEDKRIAIVHPPLLKETATAMGMDSSPWPSAAVVSRSYLNVIEDSAPRPVHFVPGYEPELKSIESA